MKQFVFTPDEIIERANQRGNANQSEEGNIDGPYIVQGDIAMTKEEYEEHMAEWEKQKAELIAKGEMQPDKQGLRRLILSTKIWARESSSIISICNRVVCLIL